MYYCSVAWRLPLPLRSTALHQAAEEGGRELLPELACPRPAHLDSVMVSNVGKGLFRKHSIQQAPPSTLQSLVGGTLLRHIL